jgi:hypothetical protein
VAARATAPSPAVVTVPCRARVRTVGRRAGQAELLLGRALGREAAMAYGAPRRKAEAMSRIRPMCGLPLFFFHFYLSRICFKLPKFVKTCRSVQKLQTKFYMNTLEPLCTVALTKLTFIQ